MLLWVTLNFFWDIIDDCHEKLQMIDNWHFQGACVVYINVIQRIFCRNLPPKVIAVRHEELFLNLINLREL